MTNPPPARGTKAIVLPAKRRMVALTAKEVNLDRGVGDFVKWILNFEKNETGHFRKGESLIFAQLAAEQINQNFSGYLHVDDVESFLTRLGKKYYEECFVSTAAMEDFLRQVRNYIEFDEFIGVKPNVSEHSESGTTGEQPSPNRRRRRKAS